MRAAFGLISLLLVLVIVLFSAKSQLKALAPAAPAASAVGATVDGQPRPATPEAVRQQVQELVDQSARRASDALP
ncbi:hypothetical protein RQP53_07945 [Paucibacter sp. APW11]|uniref:Efflux transporter periplasmic adaptor subunit n=1 Tax=Roseateles aquae TaxID=3077235 RepID=A0ABU3P9H1_9BURK|nr:hypothetical protein [Paucibacter sp. APW11]MDT8999197.1 hypothetical protein [Paucibacter sp. APW11]